MDYKRIYANVYELADILVRLRNLTEEGSRCRRFISIAAADLEDIFWEVSSSDQKEGGIK